MCLIEYRTSNCRKNRQPKSLVERRTPEKYFPKSGQRTPNNRTVSLFQGVFYGTCSVVRRTCFMDHRRCSIDRRTCSMVHSTCFMIHRASSMNHGTCSGTVHLVLGGQPLGQAVSLVDPRILGHCKLNTSCKAFTDLHHVKTQLNIIAKYDFDFLEGFAGGVEFEK